MFRTTALLALLTLLAPGAGARQPASPAGNPGPAAAATAAPLALSLDKALEIALSENPTIKIADLEIERQMYVRRETLGNLVPGIDASGAYTRNFMNPVMFMPEGVFGPGSGGPMRMGFSNSFQGNVTASMPLYMPTIYRTLDLNEDQLAAAVEAARASKVTLAAEVKKAYYNVLLAQQTLDVLHASKENVRQYVGDTRVKLDQGLASEYDLITAEVQLSNLRPNIIQTENAITSGKQLLKMYLYLPLDLDITLDGSLDAHSDRITATTPVLSTDVSDNTDLRQLELQKKILESQFHVMRGQRIPTLAASVTYQVQSQSNSFRFSRWPGSSYAGVQLSVPIFSGFRRVNQERQLRNNIDQLTLQHQYLTKNVDVQVKNAIDNVVKAREEIRANAVTVSQAERGYRITKTRYDNEMSTILELNTAELSLTQANLNYSQSVYNYLTAMADYEKIIGKEE